jgi:hypothetical protein
MRAPLASEDPGEEKGLDVSSSARYGARREGGRVSGSLVDE